MSIKKSFVIHVQRAQASQIRLANKRLDIASPAAGRISAATPEGLAGASTSLCFPQHHPGSTLRTGWRFNHTGMLANLMRRDAKSFAPVPYPAIKTETCAANQTITYLFGRFRGSSAGFT